MASDGPGSDDDDDDEDNDACDRSIEYEYADSAGLHQPLESCGTPVTQQKAIGASELGADIPGITHFQQPLPPLEISKGTGLVLDSRSATGHVQTYQELPTTSSDCLSWFDPFEVSTSAVTGLQPSWWTKSTMDEHRYCNSEPVDIGLLDLPQSSDGSKDKECLGSNGGNTTGDTEKKGSVTLTLSQVDAVVAQEIMGSVLKHSAGLKIRCIVNDD